MDRIRSFFAPNRIAVYLTAIASLATALAPVVADLDTSDTIALATGLAGLVGVVAKWLSGWQAHEAREADTLQRVETAELPPSTPTDVPA